MRIVDVGQLAVTMTMTMYRGVERSGRVTRIDAEWLEREREKNGYSRAAAIQLQYGTV